MTSWCAFKPCSFRSFLPKLYRRGPQRGTNGGAKGLIDAGGRQLGSCFFKCVLLRTARNKRRSMIVERKLVFLLCFFFVFVLLFLDVYLDFQHHDPCMFCMLCNRTDETRISSSECPLTIDSDGKTVAHGNMVVCKL